MSEKIYSITEEELLIRIFHSVNEFKKCINEYDSLITDKIITLNNYEYLLKIIHYSEENNSYLWNLALLKSGENLNSLKMTKEIIYNTIYNE